MRRSYVFIGFLTIISITLQAQTAGSAYNYTVDLTRVVDDRIYVELTPPPLPENEVTFYLPKIVPGTYAIADYGRYVTELKATDKKGNVLPVEKVDDNTYKIREAKKVARISYYVDDTWDTKKEGPEIFWPAGTNIEEGKNYVINTSGFFGYFDGQKEVPFRFNVIRNKDLYGSTGLIPVQTGASTQSLKLEKGKSDKNKVVDTYQATDYDQLVDSPLMYSKPDTAIVRVANTEVLVASYSPNKKITAKEIAGSIREVLMAQKEYLGGTLPVDKYAFLFYFTDQPVMRYGALEHSYSSMYYLPEATIGEMNQQLRDFAAHEFFHIVTPLTVHSNEIENFDFNNPKMSQHLWMYEGVTEYFAGHVQVQYGLIDINQYVETLQEKMFGADMFSNVAFTELSKFALDKYEQEYDNVYLKGALIGLCLDIKLRKLSGGKYGLRNLMLDLSQKFGKNRAFDDNVLFDEITKMTYPEIGEFFERHVKGSTKLPLTEVFREVGIEYTEAKKFEDFSLGISNEMIGLTEDPANPRLRIKTTSGMNEMGRAVGFQEGDILIAINNDSIPSPLGPEFGSFVQGKLMGLATMTELSYTVLRADSTGQQVSTVLKAPVTKVQVYQRHFMAPAEDATREQLALRESWLKP